MNQGEGKHSEPRRRKYCEPGEGKYSEPRRRKKF